MKKSPEESKLRERLKPSIFSGGGFLGDDTRELEEIINEDLNKLEEHSVEKTELVELLKKAYNNVKQGYQQKVKLTENLEGEFFEAKGHIPSPFRGDGVFEKGEARIQHQESGKTIIITALSINLIEKHDFFQGQGSRYRIEPVETYNMLKGIDAKD